MAEITVFGNNIVLDPDLEVLTIKTGRGKRDFAPLYHSHWIIQQGHWQDSAQCARCGHVSSDIGRFCALCGAKMDDDKF